MSTTSLFVIGSMTEGMVHFSRIKDFIVSQRPASVVGSVYRLKVGYPVLSLGGSQFVQGFLFEIKKSELLLQLLDQFYGYDSQRPERSLHIRTSVTVHAEADEPSTADTYVINLQRIPQGAVVLPDPDWKRALAERPPLTQTLTERQRSYVLKLGSSSGREILPIDLSLYRELMSLEIIIDKGRRLALSKFGQEVYRYLS